MLAIYCQQAEASVSWTSDNQIKSDSALCGNVTDRDEGKPKPRHTKRLQTGFIRKSLHFP